MRLDDAERRGHSSWRGRTGSHAFTAKWEDTYPSAVMVIPFPEETRTPAPQIRSRMVQRA
jgi:hypothetical protein